MKVTEKCDVCGFGIVALEILVGRYPQEVLLCLESEEFGQHFLDFLDKRLAPPKGIAAEVLMLVLRLILKCIHKNPLCRPTMNLCPKSCSHSLCLAFNMSTLHNLVHN